MKNIKYLFLFLIIFGLSSCNNNPTEPTEESNDPKNAMLFYAASANDLESHIWKNIQDIAANYVPTENKNIYVYFKVTNKKSTLYRVKKSELIAVKEYDATVNCATAETLDLVMSDVSKLENVIKITDILFSSHGSSWLPTIFMNALSTDESTPQPQNNQTGGIIGYSFGQDYLDSRGTTINIDKMAEVLQKYDLTSIIFDVCYMCSIEVLYELRNSAKYILASPAEILAAGMYYEKMTPYFTQPTTLQTLSKIAEESYKFYNSQTNPIDKSIVLTVTDCEKLAELVPLIKEITAAYGDQYNSQAAPSTILRYDGNVNSVAKDYYTYLTNLLTLSGNNSYKEPLKTAWDKAFPTLYKTEYLFQKWPMKNAHGIAGYIYRETNMKTEFNTYYKSLSWGKLIMGL